MTDFLARASEHLAARLQDGRDVVYVRGDQTITVNANVGRSQFRFDDQAGASIVARSRDYLIATDDLILDGQPAEPEPGDRIVETIDGVDHTFEVRSPAPNEPDWRYDDPDRRWMRIHTREVRP